MSDPYRRGPGAYSWLPGFLRRFLNLDDELPRYPPGSGGYSEPVARPSAPAYVPPRPAQPPTWSTPAQSQPAPQRFAATYTPPAAAAPGQAAAGPPPPVPRAAPPPDTAMAGTGSVTPGANLPPTVTEGYVQPIGYLLRAYARGALPPQGLEQFTRETRATTTDVWNFYSYWIRFQTDELFRIGRELLDAVVGERPARGDTVTTPSGQTIRRIRVTTGNGNGDDPPIDRVATTTTIDPPPVPTPAPPPTPPATTATFSPTVTADDTAIPPEGRDTRAEFAARVDQETGATAADLADAAGDVADDVKDATKNATDDTGTKA
ncbi:MAG: hypothetical protein OHK0015_39000 [Chloroflexi bacterium OHK40]